MRSALPSQTDKPRYVAAMFGRIAGRYDLMNTLMTGGRDEAWRAMVARDVLDGEAGAPHAGQAVRQVLDVGTGTGKLTAALARADPRATVVGVDFAEPMLRAATPGLRLAAADALRLPFASGRFDGTVSAFVMRNVADLKAAVAEQVRVLRPGGRLVILETTPGPPGLLRPLFRLYFRGIVPLLGELVAGDPSAYTYLPESTAAFLEPERLADVLRDQGLEHVVVRRLALGSVAVTAGRKRPERQIDQC